MFYASFKYGFVFDPSNSNSLRAIASGSKEAIRALLVRSRRDDEEPTGDPLSWQHPLVPQVRPVQEPHRACEELLRIWDFLTPSKAVAEKYANANRNIGFEPEIIDDLKRKNRPAGEFMGELYSKGRDAWDDLIEKMKVLYPDEAPGLAVDKHLKVDGNLIDDVCGYIIGSKIVPTGMDAPTLFSMSSGAPDWVYDELDQIGIDSGKYRPKVYTVVVTVKKPLITSSKAQAKSAHQKGYDSVVFYGSDLVAGVPEVAVFDPGDVKIRHVEAV